MKRIVRETYLARLKGLINTPDIKIITGIRRSGKSMLMVSFLEYLKETRPNANFIYINVQDLESERLKEDHALHDEVLRRHVPGVEGFLFVDEVQMCPSFELAINSLHSKGMFDIYLTGSNAFLMSSDLATLFTGRYMEVHVFPFSFQEFLAYQGKETTSLDESFEEYAIKGGLAGSYAYVEEKDRTQYLKEVYETIVTRDLIERYHLGNKLLFDRIAFFLMDNISNLSSSNKIANVLAQEQCPSNHVTVHNYLSYLCNAFLFYHLPRYDIKGKTDLKTKGKYYLSDIGLRYALLGSKDLDYGKVYENIVCVELLRRGYQIFIGKLYDKEIDFIACKNEERVYIQVSADIQNKETFQRECAPLLAIRDAYPKMIIARTKQPTYSYEGIKIVDLPRWLSGKEGL